MKPGDPMPPPADRPDPGPRVDLDPTQPPPSSTRSAIPTPSSETLRRLGERAAGAARYRLQGEIARGGMGAILEVFDEDLRRRLAMKVILDRETKAAATAGSSVEPATLSRFLEEAQITGQLDHPGIVPVHELGLDAGGQVYFTMRLVQGRDLEAIFDLAARGADDWTLPRAVSVLHKVCEAMAFAHEKGVVHRDLKPHNVMVGRFGEVYVMDWGLARVRDRADTRDLRVRTHRSDQPGFGSASASGAVTTQGAADGALYTMDGDVVGTPSYMAPEQARGEVASIDARSDVYSVGAMLYRLLAGHAPYATAGERPAGMVVLRRVLAGPPVAIEAEARTAPAELVAICGKAMARAPGDRYQGMLELAQDLRAFLEGRVVSAFETGALAEARKWVRRNRGFAAALAAAVLALMVGLTGSLVFAGRARDSARAAETRRVEAAASAELAERRRDEAAASAATADRQARIARAVNEFLNDDLLAAIAPEHDGKDVTVRMVLDRAAARLGVTGLGDDPEVEAAVRMTIGTSYQRLGEARTAQRHLERALELREESQGERSEPVLQSMRAVAAVWHELGRHEEAIDLYRQALALAREILGDEHRGTLATINDLATVLGAAGRLDESLELQQQALPLQVRLFGEDDENTLSSRNNLALLYRQQGRHAEAAQNLREVLARRRATAGPVHPLTLVAMTNLALTLGDLDQLDEGEALAREVLEAYRGMFEADHPKVANAVGNVGTFAFRRGRYEAAEALFREALQLRLRRAEPGSSEVLLAKHNLASSIKDPQRREDVVALRQEILDAQRRESGPEHARTIEAMANLANALYEAKRLDQAEALDRELLALQRTVSGAGHPDVARTALNLATVLRDRGDTVAARETIEEALAAARAAHGEVHGEVVRCLRALGDLQRHAEDRAGAVVTYRQALDLARRVGADGGDAAYLLHRLAGEHAALRQFDEALPFVVEGAALCERLWGKDAVGTRSLLQVHGQVLTGLRRFAEAESLLLEGVQRSVRLDGQDSKVGARLRGTLARMYDDWGKPDEAAKWR